MGVKPVRELLGVMAVKSVSEGVSTTGTYTQEAKALEKECRITLIDGADLLSKILALTPKQQAQLLGLATAGDYTTPRALLVA